MNPIWHIRTGRLHLSPVGWADLPDLRRLKGDPAIYAQMLGGVRNHAQVAEELAADTQYWAARGVGMWMARPATGGPALGMTGIHDRPDGRSPALRFAFDPACRGHGLARMMTARVEEGARALGYHALNLDVRETQEAAIALYESMGYIRWGIHPAYARVGGRTVRGIYYYKPLQPHGRIA